MTYNQRVARERKCELWTRWLSAAPSCPTPTPYSVSSARSPPATCPYVPPSTPTTRGSSRLLEAEGTDLLVAERDNQVVGYIVSIDSLTLFANGVVTKLLELYVQEEERGRGIGRHLVNQAVAGARNRGAVELTVPSRRAGAFYLNPNPPMDRDGRREGSGRG